jgi:signal transduction histidine kinase
MRAPRLRTGILLVAALAVLPLALLGWWLTERTKAAGEAILVQRIEAALTQASQSIGAAWVSERTPILDIASDERVQALLTAASSRAEADAVLAATAHTRHVLAATLRTLAGDVVATASTGDLAPGFPLTVPIHSPDGRDIIGALDVRFPLARIAPAPPEFSRIDVFVISDTTGRALVASGIDAAVLGSGRFEWGAMTWIARQRRLHEPPLVLSAAAPLDPIMRPLQQAARTGALALLAIALLAAAVSLLAARRIAGPLERLRADAARISAGDLGHDVAADGPREVRDLAHDLDALRESLRTTLDRLAQAQALAAVGEFAGAIAHEVRNPMTAARVELERLRRRLPDAGEEASLADAALAGMDRVDDVVRSTLRLARSAPLQRRRTVLQEIVRRTVTECAPVVDRFGTELRTELPEGEIAIDADEAALTRMLANLVANAAEASGSGGQVALRAGMQNGVAIVEVVDSGPGMTSTDRTRAFQPLRSTRPGGTGLGLPVARRIAVAHGGTIELLPGDDGGLCARVTLPVRASDRA